jgi:hypothetical protein
MNMLTIHNEALTMAREAERNYISQYGEPYYCGFAWVTVNPGRNGKLRNALKAVGFKKSWTPGWVLWNPAGNGTQSMDVKEAGAQAYAAILRDNNIPAYAGSRAD